MTMTPGKYQGLRRIADDTGRFQMLAVDQRPPIESLVTDALTGGEDITPHVTAVKEALIENLSPKASAVLLDPQYVFPKALPLIPRNKGVLVTLEYDKFDEAPDGRRSSAIPDWDVAKIRASGGDAVKLLAWYRPDAGASVIEHQKAFVAGVGEQCARHDIPFVFELLVYPLPTEAGHTADYIESPTKKTEHVLESVETFASSEYGVDLFKLESPVPTGSLGHDGSQQAFDDLARAAGRPWVMLSAGADPESFKTMLELAYNSGASGYLAGRAIWWDECKSSFPDVSALRSALSSSSASYMDTINELTAARATPWTQHDAFGGGPELSPAGATFRESYLTGTTE